MRRGSASHSCEASVSGEVSIETCVPAALSGELCLSLYLTAGIYAFSGDLEIAPDEEKGTEPDGQHADHDAHHG